MERTPNRPKIVNFIQLEISYRNIRYNTYKLIKTKIMAKQSVKRAYKSKDVDMLTACSTIISQAENQKATLVAKRTNWADPFFPELQTRIQNAFSDVLGIDNAKAMREATITLTNIQTNALNDLAEFKIQIVEDFKTDKTRRDEILTTLGFTAHHKAAQVKDQEALIQLLLQFKKNMTATLQNEITAKGMAAATINTIISHADTLKSANITQETLKGTRQEISQEGVEELNEIYKSVISIARISAKFFKDDKVLQDEFSYSKTVSKLNKTKHGKEDLNLPPDTE